MLFAIGQIVSVTVRAQAGGSPPRDSAARSRRAVATRRSASVLARVLVYFFHFCFLFPRGGKTAKAKTESRND